MSDLETLKAQIENEDCCWQCGRLAPADPHECPRPHPGVARLLEQRSGLLALVQQHEATIAELNTQLADLRGYITEKLNTLAEAEKVIQQQARELEEADNALISLRGWDCDDSSLLRGIRQAALARHSARAQQAEAKKEESHD